MKRDEIKRSNKFHHSQQDSKTVCSLPTPENDDGGHRDVMT